MKKIFLFLTTILIGIAGCNNNSAVISNNNSFSLDDSSSFFSSISSESFSSSDNNSSLAEISISSSEEKEITAMKKEVFDQLRGSLKLVNTTKYKTLNKVGETYVETSSFTEKNIIIYEDVDNSSLNSSYKTYNPTDRYENIFYDRNGIETDRVNYLMSVGRNVGKEYINRHNEVDSRAVVFDEGDTLKWVSSIYQNLFEGLYSEEYNFSENEFKTEDGVHYNFTGSLLNIDAIFKSLYLANGSTNSFGIEVHDNKPTSIYGSTYETEEGGKWYCLEFNAEVILDDVHTSRMTPYAHEDFHNRIQNAIDKAKENNYTATIIEDDLNVTYKFTSDMLVIISNDGISTDIVGYYPFNEGRAQFHLENGKYIQTAVSDDDFSQVFPTFDIAVEILMETTQKNLFTSRDEMGYFAAYFAYGGRENYIDGEATIELTDDDELKELKYTYTIGDITSSVKVEYKDFGTTSNSDIDVDSIVIPDAPTTWKDYNVTIYNQMVELFGEDTIPYLECPVEWDVNTGINYMKNYGYYSFSTKGFASSSDRDNFVAQYKDALLNDGYALLDEKYNNYDLYGKGSLKIAVAPASYGMKMSLMIFVD